MPIAIIASRPSVATSSGVLIVIPSTSVLRIWSADVASIPARSSRSVRRTPIQRAAPRYRPPTSLETQVRVMSRSMSGIASRSSRVNVTSRSTSPSMVSVQSSGSTSGSVSRVSTR